MRAVMAATRKPDLTIERILASRIGRQDSQRTPGDGGSEIKNRMEVVAVENSIQADGMPNPIVLFVVSQRHPDKLSQIFEKAIDPAAPRPRHSTTRGIVDAIEQSALSNQQKTAILRQFAERDTQAARALQDLIRAGD